MLWALAVVVCASAEQGAQLLYVWYTGYAAWHGMEQLWTLCSFCFGILVLWTRLLVVDILSLHHDYVVPPGACHVCLATPGLHIQRISAMTICLPLCLPLLLQRDVD